jgi:hypothetical protein
MSSRQRSRAQPQGRSRSRPGSTGKGAFFHVEVRPKSEFRSFRSQDVGEKGGIERVAGKRSSGWWSTQKWLIGKEHARVEGGRLAAETVDAKRVLKALGSAAKRVRGDRFKAGAASERAEARQADRGADRGAVDQYQEGACRSQEMTGPWARL